MISLDSSDFLISVRVYPSARNHIKATMGELLRCELAEHLLNDVALIEAVPDAGQGEFFQRRNVVLNETSSERSTKGERGGQRPYLRVDILI